MAHKAEGLPGIRGGFLYRHETKIRKHTAPQMGPRMYVGQKHARPSSLHEALGDLATHTISIF